MGEDDYENVEIPKKRRHRKKHLYNSILKLMEFYFSDSNLSKDRFLIQQINESPYVDLSIFLKFNKIRKLNCDIEDIRKAIGKSELIELSEDRDKVKRKLPIKFNENVDKCTIYVENIKADADHEWISQLFSDFGKVVYVSIPKYKHNKTNKGFAFVEFQDEEGAQNALTYFETIGCKMPSETSPENLKSIQTFEDGNEQNEEVDKNTNKNADSNEIKLEEESKTLSEVKNEENNGSEMVEQSTDESVQVKRKLEETAEESASKKQKIENIDEKLVEEEIQAVEMEDTENKKKKKHKKDKKKNLIQELGIQVLSKPEWKKMRNRYLDLQKKKMKEFKQYLNRQKYSQRNYDKSRKQQQTDVAQFKEEPKENSAPKLEFLPGVIVKLKLPEPVIDIKKFKNDAKLVSSEIKYIDVPIPGCSNEIFIRFNNNKGAKEFCTKDFTGEKTLLEGDEEQTYWEKIQVDREHKFSKNVKKQRGREKLLKKAEKIMAQHIKFDEGD
ncbi:unnamed protein product [Phyllotreta striolata]|uniref:La-related protein 7 n=1 Tax=Phyllotreta striolata TaxID=444603 RepID=A0A9N9TAY0_PHYSR|nr:unnamed protein product [Phyllotreta striolata]